VYLYYIQISRKTESRSKKNHCPDPTKKPDPSPEKPSIQIPKNRTSKSRKTDPNPKKKTDPDPTKKPIPDPEKPKSNNP